MQTIPLKTFEKILSKLKPACSHNAVTHDMPPSETNVDTHADSVDAAVEQNEMSENLREGHITGTGRSVSKNAAERTPAQIAEAKARNEFSANYKPELSLFNYNMFYKPVESALGWNRTLLSTAPTAALGYGLLGWGGLSAAQKIRNFLNAKELTEEEKRSQRNNALLAGLGAGAVGLGIRKWSSINKKSFGMDPLTVIAAKLQEDSSLSSIQQQQMLAAVAQMSGTQQLSLARILSTLAGAGIGAAVARYLANMGVVGTIGGSLLGALIGSRAGSVNIPVPGSINNSTDFFGRPM